MRWVKRKGGIWHCPDPRPVDRDIWTDHPLPRLDGECMDCPRKINKRSKRCRECFDIHRGVGKGHRRQSPPDVIDVLMARLERNFDAIQPPVIPLGVTCHCGCLLLPDESCPSCRVWAIIDAARASWADHEIHYAPNRLEVAA